MSLVLDSSVALAWIYADETTDAVLRLSDEIRIHGAWVPGLWLWEIANVLQLNVRRGRHAGDFRDGALSSLALLPIKVDAEADRQAWGVAVLDRLLRAAAAREGVQLLGE